MSVENNVMNIDIKTIKTGLAWIDDQHYMLLLQIQDIYSAYQNNLNKEKVAEVFAFLFMYVENHFSQEEQTFHVLEETEKLEHLSQHLHFKEKMDEFKRAVKQDSNKDAILELAHYCQHWFINHIRVTDQNLVFRMKQIAAS